MKELKNCMIKFGVAGNSNSFYDEGYKHTYQAADWCKKRNLDLFEYSFGHGVNMSLETATLIKNSFQDSNISLSSHAPYYINMANEDPLMIDKSIKLILSTIEKSLLMGSKRVIIHPASQGKMDRKRAELLMLDNIHRLSDVLSESNFSNDLILCWETMGKVGQMGTVEEIIEICKIRDNFYPCIDFGHINAREQGILNNPQMYNTIIQKLQENLKKDNFLNMHIHFSKIQFSNKGEVKHLTFQDELYGPKFEPLAGLIAKYNIQPWIVCESDGTQAEDAIIMKNIFENILKEDSNCL